MNKSPVTTPWGIADHVSELRDGIRIVSTSSHGGAFVPRHLLKKIPCEFFALGFFADQRADGWFEEDCDACIPVVFFPEHFRDHFGDEFDAVYKSAVHTMNSFHKAATACSLQV